MRIENNPPQFTVLLNEDTKALHFVGLLYRGHYSTNQFTSYQNFETEPAAQNFIEQQLEQGYDIQQLHNRKTE